MGRTFVGSNKPFWNGFAVRSPFVGCVDIISTCLLHTQADGSPSRHCQSVSNDDALLEEWLKDQQVRATAELMYVLYRNAASFQLSV